MSTGAVVSGDPVASRDAFRTGDPAGAGEVAALIRPVADLLREIVGEDDAWLDAVGPDTRVDGDLLVESHELALWSLALRGRYGERVDLVAHVAGLDIDAIIALTVADVAAHVAARRDAAASPAPTATAPTATAPTAVRRNADATSPVRTDATAPPAPTAARRDATAPPPDGH